MSTPPAPLVTGQIYWVEHPEHGTFRAVCLLVSPNQVSLAFQLEHSFGIRGQHGGMMISDHLMLFLRDGRYECIMTGEPWTIYHQEPAKKIPTK